MLKRSAFSCVGVLFWLTMNMSEDFRKEMSFMSHPNGRKSNLKVWTGKWVPRHGKDQNLADRKQVKFLIEVTMRVIRGFNDHCREDDPAGTSSHTNWVHRQTHCAQWISQYSHASRPLYIPVCSPNYLYHGIETSYLHISVTSMLEKYILKCPRKALSQKEGARSVFSSACTELHYHK